jgi:peptidyl-prolyl cis-trans isomerase C
MSEQVTASHILVASKGEAKTILQNIRDARKARKEFTKRAKKHSTCPSRQRGGKLGTFGPGQMVRQFDEVCWTLPVGEISEPVKTEFGWHLILVESRNSTRF